MILRDIGLATYRLEMGKPEAECAEYRTFGFQTSCVCDLCRRCLPKLVSRETAKVLIDVSDEEECGQAIVGLAGAYAALGVWRCGTTRE